MSWIIKGQSGFKIGVTPWALDSTARSFGDLNISACTLKMQSLTYDQLIWTAEAENATGTGTIVPDMGQTVELWWNATRKFLGHVTAVYVGMKQIQITIDGPWWWMERTNLTSDILPYVGADGVTAGQTAANRNCYVFKADSILNPSALLNKFIDNLLAAGIANGVPMTANAAATMFSVPQMTLTEQSIANALATLMAWCPDSVAWFDYSGAGVPVLNISRRAGMTATTYTLASDLVEIGDIVPRMDLEVSRNEIHYVTRDASTGKPAWASQTSGTNVAGKRQIVTVSGPEIVDFLPRDDFETYTVQTAGTYYSLALVAGRDSILKTIASTWGLPNIPGIVNSISYYVTDFGSAGGTGRRQETRNFQPVTVLTDAGLPVSGLAGKKLLITDTPPAWAMALLGGISVRITGTWVVTNTTGVYSDAEKALQSGGFGFMAGWAGSSGVANLYVSGRTFDITGVLIDTAYLTATPVYKPWEYQFAVPPAGLAAALVAAQAWTPWEGPITLVADECSGDNLLPFKYNLANALAPCATMAALAKDVQHDLFRGRTTINLGAPARVDFGTLVSRVRSEPKDNIIYL